MTTPRTDAIASQFAGKRISSRETAAIYECSRQTEQQLYITRGALARLCRAVQQRIAAEEPTPEQRLELYESYNAACDIISSTDH